MKDVDISPNGSVYFRQCDEALPSHLVNISVLRVRY